jgi:hypothetical protein
MTLALAATIVGGILAPHVLPLRSASPSTAAAIWICALLLRALTAASVVLYVVLFLPHTELLHAITHWCWRAVLPVVAAHLGLDGHRVGNAAVVVPGFIMAASVLSAAVGIVRATRSVKRLLERGALGRGPNDSVIVGGPEVVLAVAGIVHPRILVSAGALAELDDAELAAGLDHERGHISRRHRFVTVLCELLRAVGRFVPGGGRALAEVNFHLERDADRFALSRHHDRLAVASAICKAATKPPRGPAVAHLGGPGVAERLRQLIDDPARQGARGKRTMLTATAALMVTLTVAAAVAIPAAAIGGLDEVGGEVPPHHHCLD